MSKDFQLSGKTIDVMESGEPTVQIDVPVAFALQSRSLPFIVESSIMQRLSIGISVATQTEQLSSSNLHTAVSVAMQTKQLLSSEMYTMISIEPVASK